MTSNLIRSRAAVPNTLAIIVPTRNEAENIALLLSRLAAATDRLPVEVLFVDDSSDETPDVVRALADQFPFPVRLLHRPPAQRNGLSGAVVDGLRKVTADWVVVMDGDLQHPPELIAQLYERARATNADIVVGSRLAADEGPIGLSAYRGIASRWLTIVARAFFPQALRNVSDPLTGLFLVRRSIVDPDQLRPEGFKILLEILVRCRDSRVSEVHFEFGERHAGESKAGLNEGLRFFRHLLRLRLTANQHVIRFFIAGALGIAVNTTLLVGLVGGLGLHYLVAAVIATQFSAGWNFGLTEAWVFSDRRRAQLTGVRLARYLLMNNALLVIHLPLMWLLIGLTGLHYAWANLLAIFATALVRYAVSDQWIWTMPSIPSRPNFFSYNIHGILGVQSMTRLPELEYFRTDDPLPTTDIQVSVDRYGTPRCSAGCICYDERLGRLGFGLSISLGEFTEVVVSPLLEKAPHVLYTNVVEPLLRWAFVRRGFALIQGSCVAYGDRAVLITARGHSGIQTILHAPPDPRRAFLGDEMVLLGRNGDVYAYPKPLLINPRLLPAASGLDPSYGERLILAVQGRIYTWLSRRIGMAMRRLRLPAASFNALMQMLFPPPKYMLDQLQPATPYRDQAALGAFALLEEGPAQVEPFSRQQAVDVVLSNATDAYAFPPYPTLARALSEWEGIDLHPLEETIIREGLAGSETLRIGWPDAGWWHQLPSVVGLADTERPDELVTSVSGPRLASSG